MYTCISILKKRKIYSQYFQPQIFDFYHEYCLMSIQTHMYQLSSSHYWMKIRDLPLKMSWTSVSSKMKISTWFLLASKQFRISTDFFILLFSMTCLISSFVNWHMSWFIFIEQSSPWSFIHFCFFFKISAVGNHSCFYNTHFVILCSIIVFFKF